MSDLLLMMLCLPVVGMLLRCLCCGSKCTIFSDSFGGSGLDDWTQTDGTWSESGGYASTSSSNARLDCDATHPDSIPSHYVSVGIYGADGDQIRVHVGDHYAQVTIGDPNGCLELCTSGGTVLTKCRVNATASTLLTLQVWYGETSHAPSNDSQLAAQLESGHVLRYNVTRSGNGVAIGTGTIASTVRFDDFIYEKHWTPTDTTCKQSAVPCLIFSDDFTRADSTGLGCSWDEVAGGWEIATNRLSVTSSKTNAACINQVRHPRAVGGVTVSCVITSTSTSDLMRIIVGYIDSNNYHFAELKFGTFGAAQLKLFARVGGTNTQLGSTVSGSVSSGATLTVCLGQGAFSASVPGVSLPLVAAVATPTTPTLCGVGTGSTAGGTITFDSFAVQRVYSSDDETCEMCEVDCTCCTNSPAAAAYVVDIGSPPLTNDECEGCEDIGGEYNLVYRGSCAWDYGGGPTLCVMDFIRCEGDDTASYNVRLAMTLEMITDTTVTPNKCYWRLKVILSTGGGTLGVTTDRPCLGWVQYQTDPDDPAIDCNAESWTLFKEGAHATSYRGSNSWHQLDEDWNILCDGLFPETVTVRVAA